jgi:hypothetical protein
VRGQEAAAAVPAEEPETYKRRPGPARVESKKEEEQPGAKGGTFVYVETGRLELIVDIDSYDGGRNSIQLAAASKKAAQRGGRAA